MQTQAATRLSSKGKVAIPKEIIAKHRWKSGQELEVIETDDGILLKSAPVFRPTQLEEVVGILQHSGEAVSLEDMQEAVRQGAQERK